MTPEMEKAYKNQSERKLFTSGQSFLAQHNGWRPGCLHTFIAVAGGGKSTLMRTLLSDAVKNYTKPNKICVWLSEESRAEFATELLRSDMTHEQQSKFYVFSELENPERVKTVELAISYFEEACKEFDIVFFDNITTSSMYMDKTTSTQSAIATRLKIIASKNNMVLVLYAHTKAEITEGNKGIIDQNDIRGSKTIVNVSHFFYVLQRFICGESIFPTIKIIKHRGQEVEQRLYALSYEKSVRMYTLSYPLSFEELKELHKKRNVL